ncbi:hypothetical protein [Bacillus sp. SM2101]|uniref:hypothetical protein n=1 Tax=Bacillus sp. SM2101 TaxID=2805366 RepID=UPI001BDE7A6D|nr:hypothetical protein [Bacillus sp. SM2101]
MSTYLTKALVVNLIVYLYKITIVKKKPIVIMNHNIEEKMPRNYSCIGVDILLRKTTIKTKKSLARKDGLTAHPFFHLF